MINLKAWRPGSLDSKYPPSNGIEMQLPILSIDAPRILRARSGPSHLDVSSRPHFLGLRSFSEGRSPILLCDLYADRVVIVLLMCCLLIFNVILIKVIFGLNLIAGFLLLLGRIN